MKPFDPSDLENQILKTQREISPLNTRANLFNLVVFSDQESSPVIDEGINYLLGKRSIRVIRIKSGGSAETSAYAGARCRRDRKDTGICLQEITIHDWNDESGSAPGSWSPLLIRGIPVILWWAMKYRGNENIFQLATEQADKIIADSAALGTEFVDVMKEMILRGLNIIDLNWIRTGDLRRNTALLFDSPERLKLLKKLREIIICGGGEPEIKLYLLWLASRLNWIPGERGFTGPDGKEIIINHDTVHDLSAGIEIFFKTHEETLSLYGRPEGCVDFQEGERKERERYKIPETGEMILKETDSVYTDSLFLEALGKDTGE
ncbi:MAG: glucose-6-phosphate dehydrogenase assembly protein OpcA [Spirochaetia bacterium]